MISAARLRARRHAGAQDVDPGRAPAFKEQPRGLRLRPHDEIGAREDGHEKRGGRRVASSVLDVLLVEARAAFLSRGIEIEFGRRVEPALARSVEEREVARVRIGRVGDGQRSARAVVVGRAARVVLDALEVRQQRAITPRGPRQSSPLVEAETMTARPGHRVDRARTAVRLAARLPNHTAVEFGLGLGRVVPVERPAQERGPSPGRLDGRIGLRPAGLNEEDAVRWIRAQPIGQNASGRSGPDDDEVELVGRGLPATPAHDRRRDHGSEERTSGDGSVFHCPYRRN